MVYLLFGVAFFFGVVATCISIAVARKYELVSHPNPIVPQHTTPVAHLGGVGIAAGAAGVFILFPASEHAVLQTASAFTVPSTCYLIGCLLFLVLGLIDDLKVLKPAPKLLLQVLVTAIVILSGMIGTFSGTRFFDMILSALFMITIINAVNVTDVCDGLVGGLAIIMLVQFSYFNHSPLALIFAGACLGFIVFNLPPAKVFLGDAGSHLLGFVIAAQALLTISRQPLWPALPVTLLIICVPLFELIFLTVMRTRKGLPWWKGSPDHFALRLQARGLSRLKTDFIAWGSALLFCVVAAALPKLWLGTQFIVLCAVLTLLATSWRYLLRWEVKPQVNNVPAQDPLHLLEPKAEQANSLPL